MQYQRCTTTAVVLFSSAVPSRTRKKQEVEYMIWARYELYLYTYCVCTLDVFMPASPCRPEQRSLIIAEVYLLLNLTKTH